MKTITVVGATSDIGTMISNTLRNLGHEVRPVSRKDGVYLDDKEGLKYAFRGAESAYLMIPFDMTALHLHERERQIAHNIVTALKGSGVRRIVLLSGLNAHLKRGSGLGAAIMEEALQEYDAPEQVFLRCGFFMENFKKGLNFLAQSETGLFQTAFRGDRPMPMIASKDIAEVAIDILLSQSFDQPLVRELHGSGSHSFEKTTRVLGQMLHYPNVLYRQCSYDESLKNMMAFGVSESFAEAVMDTAKSFNDGEQWALEKPSVSNITQTALEDFALEWSQESALRPPN